MFHKTVALVHDKFIVFLDNEASYCCSGTLHSFPKAVEVSSKDGAREAEVVGRLLGMDGWAGADGTGCPRALARPGLPALPIAES